MFDDDLLRSNFFIVTGLPKSGTTWIMNMLNALPGIVTLGEGRFFSSMLSDVPSLYSGVQDGVESWSRFIAHRKLNWLLSDEKIKTFERKNYLTESDIDQLSRRVVNDAVSGAINGMMKTARAHYGYPRLLGDKTPLMNSDELLRMLEVLPSTKVIFLYRNPKDFIVSLLFHYHRATLDARPDSKFSWLDTEDFLQLQSFIDNPEVNCFCREETAARLAGQWHEVYSTALNLSQSRPEMMMCGYETIWSEPAESLRNICRHLEIDIESRDINKAVARNSTGVLKKAGGGFLSQHIRSGQPGDWTQYLDKRLSKVVDEIIKRSPYGNNSQ